MDGYTQAKVLLDIFALPLAFLLCLAILGILAMLDSGD
jgi:hypothetical protein